MMFSCKPASQYNVLYTLGYCATGKYLCWLCTRACTQLAHIHSLHSTYMDRAYETSLQFFPLKKSPIVYRLVVYSGSWFKLLGSNSYLCWPSRSAVCCSYIHRGYMDRTLEDLLDYSPQVFDSFIVHNFKEVVVMTKFTFSSLALSRLPL